MKKVFFIVVGCLLFFNVTNANANEDKTDKLIQLLIDKEIITANEAEALVEELGDNEEKNSNKETVKTVKTSTDWTEKFQALYKKGAVIKTADDNFSLKLNFRLHGMFYYLNPENSASQSVPRYSSRFRHRRGLRGHKS